MEEESGTAGSAGEMSDWVPSSPSQHEAAPSLLRTLEGMAFFEI